MTKLYELLAVEGDLKSLAMSAMKNLEGVFTNAAGRFSGISRTFHPFSDDPTPQDRLPDEVRELTSSVNEELGLIVKPFSDWLNVAVQKENGNARTGANVVVDGKEILPRLSAPALLFIENRLRELRELYAHIPTYDTSEKWTFDESLGCYVMVGKETIKSRKVPRALPTVPATDRHPGQVHVYEEEVPFGKYTTLHRSSALSPAQKRALIDRIDALHKAVKEARNRANDVEVELITISDKVFDFIHNRE